ncbi:MAG: hypothetical protein FJZ63_00095, partial [Chlamydiae bacterium]|nr:hypothetical protein [Chlamydiota bacterium]
MASQLLQIFSHLFTTPLPYLGYDNQKNQVVIRSDLGWLDERVRLCFVKYAPLDTKGFLIETCNISTILTILVSEDCTRFQEAWVAKPSFWIPEADVAILDEDDPLPPFDLAASKKALENTLQITKEACLTYIPFTRTVIACEAATLHEITFVVCFPDNRGVFIHALYEKELLKALPYLIPSLQPLATSAPPFENHSHSKSMVEKMVKNTKKALQEHTLASKKIAQLLQNHLAFIESHKHLVHSLFLEDPSQEGLSIHKQAMLLIQKNDIDYPLPSFVDLLQKIGFAKKTKCTIKQFKEKLQEHLSYLENPRYVASLEEIKPSTNSPFLSLEVGISENRGERRFMEDASFSINTPLYLLAGVFDG